MNPKPVRRLLAAAALALSASASWPQAGVTRVDGRVTDGGKPLSGAMVILSNQGAPRSYASTTDTNGTFSIREVAPGNYIISVVNLAGVNLFHKTLQLTSAPHAPIRLDIDISGAPPAASAAPSAALESNLPAASGRVGCTASFILPVGTYSQRNSMGPDSPGGGAAVPYSAVEETWLQQVLNDGTVASSERKFSTKIYQDSHGRRRRERPICSMLYEDAEPVLISIDDPVAGYEYDLDPQNRIAYRFSLEALKVAVPAAHGSQSGARMEITREPLGSQRMEGLLVVGTRETRRLIPAPPPHMEDLKTKEEIEAAKARLEVTKAEIEEKRKALEASHTAGLTSEEDYTRQRRELDEKMHAAMLESFRIGYAETHAGQARSDKPFTIIEEVWYSSEIRAVVLDKFIYDGIERRLTNIERAEPGISLFQPPADYKIEDATGTVTIQMYPPPTLASITPASGMQGTSVSLTLTGSNFVAGGSAINVPPEGGITVSGTTVASATRGALVVHESITATFQISATASLGPQSVSVTTAGGTTLSQTFTVNPPVPRLTSLSPNNGVLGTGPAAPSGGQNGTLPAATF